MRAGRVTASTFYAACHTHIEKPARSVLRSICMPNAHRFSSAATDWGKTHESIARDQYEALHAVQHTDSVCQASGLFLSNKYEALHAVQHTDSVCQESVARDQYEALHAVQHTDSVYQASGLFLSNKYEALHAVQHTDSVYQASGLFLSNKYEPLHAVQHTDSVYQASGLFLSNKYEALHAVQHTDSVYQASGLFLSNKYEALHAVQHTDSVYQGSGLLLSIEYPMLDASPDGQVQYTCCGEGLLEVKCPYTLRESSDFGQLAWMCLVDDICGLNRSHHHYFQVHMQLFVTNKMYCDFVVWSPEGLLVERIYPDREWWVKWSAQGMLFHSKCIMPELCVKYFSKKTILGTSTQM